MERRASASTRRRERLDDDLGHDCRTPTAPTSSPRWPRFGTLETTSDVRNVTVNNAIPDEPPAPDWDLPDGRVSDTTGTFISFPHEVEEEEEEGGGGGGGGGPPPKEPTFIASMTAEISNIVVYVGGVDPNDGVIGGDAIEFDVTLTNTSTDPGAVMTAFAFQSKFSESPALASRIGDKAFYGVLVGWRRKGMMTSVKKNGTSNGLFGGRWKGICINSSIDYLPEFNAGLEDESLECGGNRADTDADGLPELQSPILGIYPGESQTVRIRIEAAPPTAHCTLWNPARCADWSGHDPYRPERHHLLRPNNGIHTGSSTRT
jgi:hypothetical protein